MSGSERKTDSEKVGYKCPPKASRFKPGRSGNPKGRQKGRTNFQALLEKQLNQKTRVKVGDQVKSIAILDAVVLRLIQAMLHGPPERVVAILKFLLPLQKAAETPTYLTHLEGLTDEEIERRIDETHRRLYGNEMANKIREVDQACGRRSR